MKKLFFFLSFFFYNLFIWSQNVNSQISIFINRYETGWNNGYYESLIMGISNNSKAQLMLVNLKMYDYNDNSIIYYNQSYSNTYLDSNNSFGFTYSNNTGSKVIMEKAWVIELQYFNMNTGGTVQIKKALKRANTIGSNMVLEDISEGEQGGSEEMIEEGVVIGDFCFDLNTKKKEAKFRRGPSGDYSGIINIPNLVDYNGIEYIVTSIKSQTFSNNRLVTSVNIPSSVKTIESSAFYVCINMTELSIAGGLEKIGNDAFYNCNGLTTITLPNSVKSIGDNAFKFCGRLTTLIIGTGISQIGRDAIDCRKLADVYCYANIVPSCTIDLGSSVRNATLHVPASLLSSYKSNFRWNAFKSIIALTDSDPKPTGITEIGNDVAADKQYYTLDGKCLEMPKRGLNIIHMNNGKTKKVVVK